MLRNLTTRLTRSLYIFSKARTATPDYLPLYQSAVFKTDNFEDVFTNAESASRYKQLLPILATSSWAIYPSRFLYTSLAFDPNNEVLKIVTLRVSGFHTQEFRLDNIIPWTFQDLYAQSTLPEPKYPVFMDDEMIYFNKAIQETLFGERDGVWNEQTVNHPKLALIARLQEKEWFDRHPIF